MKTKTLIVEDMEGPLEALAIAIRLEILEEPKPIDISGDIQKSLEERGVHVAKTYENAQNLINNGTYDLIFLDHNMPRSQGAIAEDIGYELIPRIRERNPEAYIVGTSSNDHLPKEYVPDASIRKPHPSLNENVRDIYVRLEGGRE